METHDNETPKAAPNANGAVCQDILEFSARVLVTDDVRFPNEPTSRTDFFTGVFRFLVGPSELRVQFV